MYQSCQYYLCRLICLEVRKQIELMSLYYPKNWKLWIMFYLRSKWTQCKCLPSIHEWTAKSFSNFGEFDRYEEAREEEKLRSQREDFSDMVAEVLILLVFKINLIFFFFFFFFFIFFYSFG
jgi:hypothetical protein